MSYPHQPGESAWSGKWRFDLIVTTAVLAFGANAALALPHWEKEHAAQAMVVADEARPWTTPREVLYEVEGTARTVALTMLTPSGTIRTHSTVPMMDGEEYGRQMVFESGAALSITVQNQIRGNYGTVTCRITVDGEVISEHTTGGLYATATCEGNA